MEPHSPRIFLGPFFIGVRISSDSLAKILASYKTRGFAMLSEILTELIPSYFERFVLAIGGVLGWMWGMAFGDVHLAMAWFLTIMASDYVSGVYRALRMGEYSSKKGLNGIIKKISDSLALCACSRFRRHRRIDAYSVRIHRGLWAQ